jgi:O-antigen ligase
MFPVMPRDFNGFVSLYGSFAIFIFSAILLVVPGGYSYGPLLLVIGSLVLCVKRPNFSLQKHDWIFIGVLATYFFASVLLNFVHGLSSRTYDLPLRYILAVPVYIFLVTYPPKQEYFWYGLILGALGAGAFALVQKYTADASWDGRASGFLNSIQFGDISILLAAIVLLSVLWLRNRSKNVILLALIFVSSLSGFAASFLSSSRGGWLVLAIIPLIIYASSADRFKKKIGLCVALMCVITATAYILLPDSNPLKSRIVATQHEVDQYIHGVGPFTSVSIRANMWKNGIESFADRPIVGWGSLTAIKQHYAAQWVGLNTQDDFNHLHNEYIDALAKKGIFGFSALMAIYLVPLYYFVSLMRTRQSNVMPFATAGVVLILCVMVFGLTQCFLAHNSGTMVFVFYLVIIKAYCRNIVES